MNSIIPQMLSTNCDLQYFSPINCSCRNDIEIFFDWAMSFFQRFDICEKKTVCKMGQTAHAKFIRLTVFINFMTYILHCYSKNKVMSEFKHLCPIHH